MLTKSLFLKYIQCPKYLWLAKNRKDLLPEELDKALQRKFDDGAEVEAYARQLFPEGKLAEGFFEKAQSHTKKLIEEGIQTIFQATAMTNQLMAMADVLKFNPDTNTWDIYEVKSSTEPKEIHHYDLAFQKRCFEDAGYPIGRTFLILVDNKSTKNEPIKPDELLFFADETKTVEKTFFSLDRLIHDALSILSLDEEPEVRILKQCNKPYTCPFIDHCWKHVPEESIYSLAGGLAEDKLNTLLDHNILQIKDIPREMITSKTGQRHYKAITEEPLHIDKKAITKDLAQLTYPLYYLDYETFSPVIPILDGYRPYQRIVFQYSLHVKQTPDSELEHYEFLATEPTDPTEALSKQLQAQIGNEGSVITWNMGFEKGCNTEMGRRLPQFAEFYEKLNSRVYDLMTPFKNGHYNDRRFKGSYSIKNVLPMLVPELSHKDLDISNGSLASESWAQMCFDGLNQAEIDEITGKLLAYCKLDTLAMVKIHEKLLDL